MRDRFTRVLKGHIAVARAVFPAGTNGAQIDALARASLWRAGLDFDHGTGHGIGSYLSVHEGPQRLSKTGTTALLAGHDHLQRARLLRRWRIRNPHRESARGRGAEDSRRRAADAGLRDADLRADRSHPRRSRSSWTPTKSPGSTIITHACARPCRRGSTPRPAGGLRRSTRRLAAAKRPGACVERPALGRRGPFWIFLAPRHLASEIPRFWGLEKLGFPWILSSEMSLFNGL